MSERPIRVQLSRKKGWQMPANTVKVDRTTKWGNPYSAARPLPWHANNVVEAFEQWLVMTIKGEWLAYEARDELRGKNLACWCRLDQPCHADVLLRIANEP